MSTPGSTPWAQARAFGGCGFFRGAFLRLVWAEALHAARGIEAARPAITEARAAVLAIAAKIGDQEYRTSFLERVPENARKLTLAREWLGG